MSQVTMKRLGDVTPGQRLQAGGRVEHVDPRPVVLWGRDWPAAVLVYRSSEEPSTVLEEIGPISDPELPRLGGACWLTRRTQMVAGPEPAPQDGLLPGVLLNADLDGDGLEELVAVSQQGGIEVIGTRGVSVRSPGMSNKPEIASYTPQDAQVALIGGRAVIHVLFRRKVHQTGANAELLAKIGAADPYALARVDARGISRVVLTGLEGPVHEVISVGVLSQLGASAGGEIFALFRKDEGQEVYLSRHRLDGAAIGAARRVYVPFFSGISWRATFLPQSGTALLASDSSPVVYFLEPGKPVNWVHRVDLRRIEAVGGKARLLGAADTSVRPKAIVLCRDAVYAVDAEGTFYTAAGGTYTPAEGTVSFHRIAPPSPQHGPAVVVPSPGRGDEYLVVHSRTRQSRALSSEEIAEATDRFWVPEKVAEARRRAEPALDDFDAVRDRLVAEEREQRNVAQPIASVEEWRELLPDSYSAVRRDRQSRLETEFLAQLTFPIEKPLVVTPDYYREIDRFRVWLAAIELPAEMVFEVVRRGVTVQAFRVDAELGPLTSSYLDRIGIDWRVAGGEVLLVTTLSIRSPASAVQTGMYLIRAKTGGR